MGAMLGTEAQKRDFSDRLVRIAAGGENTTRHVHVGPSDEALRARSGKRRRNRKVRSLPRAGQRSFFTEIFMVPLALAFGAAAVTAGRVVEFHVLTDEMVASTGAAAPYVPYANIVLSALVALLVGRMLRLRGGARGKALLAGFAAMALFESLAVVRYPDVFATLYSADYVSQVVAKLAA